jgi:carnitine 3-dehydrogenase
MSGRSDQRGGPDVPATRITTPNEGVRHAGWDESAPVPAPLRLHDTTVLPAWCDYNGHMSESSYLYVVGNNADAFFRFFGVDEDYRAGGASLYTAETHLHHKGEAREGDRLTFTLQVLGVDAKRLHLVHEVVDDATGRTVATAEQMLLHVDMSTGKVTPFPPHLRSRLEAVAAAHSVLPVPDYVGHVMGLPPR